MTKRYALFIEERYPDYSLSPHRVDWDGADSVIVLTDAEYAAWIAAEAEYNRWQQIFAVKHAATPEAKARGY